MSSVNKRWLIGGRNKHNRNNSHGHSNPHNLSQQIDLDTTLKPHHTLTRMSRNSSPPMDLGPNTHDICTTPPVQDGDDATGSLSSSPGPLSKTPPTYLHQQTSSSSTAVTSSSTSLLHNSGNSSEDYSLSPSTSTPKSWEMNLKEYVPYAPPSSSQQQQHHHHSSYVKGGEYLRPLVIQQHLNQMNSNRSRTVSTDDPMTQEEEDEVYDALAGALSKSFQPQDVRSPNRSSNHQGSGNMSKSYAADGFKMMTSSSRRSSSNKSGESASSSRSSSRMKREISEEDMDISTMLDNIETMQTGHSYQQSSHDVFQSSAPQLPTMNISPSRTQKQKGLLGRTIIGNNKSSGEKGMRYSSEDSLDVMRRPRRRNTSSQSFNVITPGVANGDAAVRGGKVFGPVFGRSSKRNSHVGNGDGSNLDDDGSTRSGGAFRGGGGGGVGGAFRMERSNRKIRSCGTLDLTVRGGHEVTHRRGAKSIIGTGELSVRNGLLFGGGPRGMVVDGPSTTTPTTHNNQDQMTRDKRIFYTKVHNSSKNSTEAYLCDDKSARGQPIPNIRSSYSNLPPVTETTKDIALSPVEGMENRSGHGEFFFAPVILASCRQQLLQSLWSKTIDIGSDESSSDYDRATSASYSGPLHHGMVMLGEAVVNEQASKTASKSSSISLSSSSSKVMNVWFAVRQNFLLEYEDGEGIENGQRPRGFAFLQSASIKDLSNDAKDSLQLDYLVDPMMGKRKSMTIRVVNPDDKCRWISIFEKASQLSIDDLYEYDRTQKLKELRYATIQPARRKRHTEQSKSRVSNQSASSSAKFVTEHGGIMKKNPSFSLSQNAVNTQSSYVDYSKRLAIEECDCALKIIDKSKFWELVRNKKERGDAIVREVTVQASLTLQCRDVPGLLRMKSFFETRDKVILELELVQKTNLFHHVQAKGTLSETEAAQIMHDLLTCILAMGETGVAHRDIKPQNILMADQNTNREGVNIKLGDFGNAAFVEPDNRVSGQCGTAGFVAPEILLHRRYENKVDMFSAGVTLYLVLCGYEPFYGENEVELIQNNREGRIKFDESDWGSDIISVEGRDLVEKMLEKDPMKRITAERALNHAWIRRRYAALPTSSQCTCLHDSNECIIS